MGIELHKDRPALRSHTKKELYKLIVARSDILAAQTACDSMLREVDAFGHPLYYPLFVATVTCYARPFTHNRSLGALGCKWQKFRNPMHQRIHDNLIDARNKFIAHSDTDARKVEIVPPGTGRVPGPKIAFQTSLTYFPVEYFSEVRDVALNLNRRINAEIKRIMGELYEVGELYEEMDLPNKPFPLRHDDEGL